MKRPALSTGLAFASLYILMLALPWHRPAPADPCADQGRQSCPPGVKCSRSAEKCDDSVDIYFGPKAPMGKESNWIPTDPNRNFELMFRLYAPTKALFDKAWWLPNVEVVSSP